MGLLRYALQDMSVFMVGGIHALQVPTALQDLWTALNAVLEHTASAQHLPVLGVTSGHIALGLVL